MLRAKIPIVLTMIAGCFMILNFFLAHPWVARVAEEIQQWCLIVFATAMILGIANILRVNWNIIRRKGTDWPYKVVLVVSMLAMLGIGGFDLVRRGNISQGSLFSRIYDVTYTPLAASMFALLAFFIASAAFRAFRARNSRATILLLSAAIVMIGRVPLGRAISDVFPNLTEWLMSVPNTAGQRGLIIGAALGVIATGLRIVFGIERPYLRGK